MGKEPATNTTLGQGGASCLPSQEGQVETSRRKPKSGPLATVFRTQMFPQGDQGATIGRYGGALPEGLPGLPGFSPRLQYGLELFQAN